MPTNKLRLALTIGLLAVTTLGTGSARVGGIDQFDGYALDSRLVLDKLPKLVEGPTVMPPPLHPANLDTIPYAGEVFEPDTHIKHRSCIYDASAYRVIVPRLKPSFLPAESPEQFSRSTSAFGLEATTGSKVAFSDTIYGLSTVNLTPRSSRYVDNTEINSQPCVIFIKVRRRRFNINANADVVITLSCFPDDGTCGVLPSKQALLIFTYREFQSFQPTSYGRKANRPIPFTKRKDPGVVVDTGWSYLAVLPLLYLENTSGTGDSANGKVCCKAMCLFKIVIAISMNADIARSTHVTAYTDCIVASISERYHRFIDSIFLFVGQNKFAFDSNRLHTKINLLCEVLFPRPQS